MFEKGLFTMSSNQTIPSGQSLTCQFTAVQYQCHRCRIFVCFILMLNAFFFFPSYTTRKSVTINFSVATHSPLTKEIHPCCQDDPEILVRETRNEAQTKSAIFFSPFTNSHVEKTNKLIMRPFLEQQSIAASRGRVTEYTQLPEVPVLQPPPQ